MSNVFYKNGGGDEQYTPAWGVEMLLPHIQHLKNKVIWLPFDKQDSKFVSVLKSNGFKVKYSHIEYGQNFFGYEPEEWDVLISNPPYKNKRAYWERALSFNKPFALLLPINILSDSFINITMNHSGKKLQLLIPQKRMRFYNALTSEVGKQPTFKASFFAVDLFEQDIILDGAQALEYGIKRL
jgi:hypothetical protein